MRTNLIETAWVAAALLAASPVTPVRADESKSVSVSFADLNLASEAGRDALHRRIERAAEQACAAAKANSTTRIQSQYRSCLTQARASATRQVEASIAAASVAANVADAANARN
jgi:UrcA family protein